MAYPNSIGGIVNSVHSRSLADRRNPHISDQNVPVVLVNIFRSIEDLEGQATTYNNLANVYYGKRNAVMTMKYARTSLDINVKIGNRHGQALNLATIGNVYGMKGDPEEALRHFRLAEAIFVDIGEKTHLPILQCQISRYIC